jgi:hypothetical protein
MHHNLEEIDAIVCQLPEQWQKYVKSDRAPFLRSMQQIQDLLGFPSRESAYGDSWNLTIDWLDDHYQDWRGCLATSKAASLREVA